MKKQKRINLLIILAVMILILLWLGVVVWYEAPERTVVYSQPGLEEMVEEIDITERMLKLFNLGGLTEEIESISLKSLEAWEGFVRVYKDNQPAGFSRTRDWSKKLNIILNHIRRADELARENNFVEAGKERDEADKIFKNIKEENGWIDYSGELLALYLAGEKVAVAENKEAVINDLENLKLKFTAVKELYSDDENIEHLEKLIGTLDKQLDGPEFKRTQKGLVPLLEKLYIEY